MYDFPRSHHLNGEQENIDPVPLPRSKHCYTNAAPVQVNGDVFRYDFTVVFSEDDPVSPQISESSSAAHYSNLPSPALLNNPPVINRGLKPGRKTSESASNEPSPQPVMVSPPNVDRKLKPTPTTRSKDNDSVALKLCAPPAGRSGTSYNYHSLRHTRANPSPTPRIQSDNSDTEQRVEEIDQVIFCDSGRFPFYPRPGSKRTEIQYLDLDLDSNETSNPSTPPTQGNQVPKSPSTITTTVYKTVDFLKTEAFNRTRQKVEEERKQNSDAI